MQLILVISKMDMINHICQMLSFCWKLLSAYLQKKWLLSTLLSTVVTAMCACIRNTNLCFFQCVHASQVGQHYILHPNFELWKRHHYPIIPTGMRSNIKGRWQPGHQCELFHCSSGANINIQFLSQNTLGLLGILQRLTSVTHYRISAHWNLNKWHQ